MSQLYINVYTTDLNEVVLSETREKNRWQLYFLKQAPFWYVTGEGEAWAKRGAKEEGVGRTS